MAEEFAKVEGLRLIAGGSDNHLLNLKVLDLGINGKEAQDLLDSVHITLNKEAIPDETLSPFKTSGVRIGAAAITSRGFKEEDMPQIAEFIYLAATDFENKAEYIKEGVCALTDKYPIYQD